MPSPAAPLVKPLPPFLLTPQQLHDAYTLIGTVLGTYPLEGSYGSMFLVRAPSGKKYVPGIRFGFPRHVDVVIPKGFGLLVVVVDDSVGEAEGVRYVNMIPGKVRETKKRKFEWGDGSVKSEAPERIDSEPEWYIKSEEGVKIEQVTGKIKSDSEDRIKEKGVKIEQDIGKINSEPEDRIREHIKEKGIKIEQNNGEIKSEPPDDIADRRS